MAYRDLQEFVKRLDAAGELVRIKEPVSPRLEITEITDRVSKRYGPALLFENVRGFKMSVLTNAFGSYKRMAMALEVPNLNALGEEVMDFIEAEAPDTIIKKLRLIPKLRRMDSAMPKLVKKARCQEVVYKGEDVDLGLLPVLHCWPEDGGPFITLPVVFTRHPETGIRNAGMYRMQIFDKNTTGMHWHAHKGGAQHYRVAERLRKRLPVAVAIGPDPAMTYAATAPLPEDIDEVIFAGFLRNEPVELVKCLTIDLEVPAYSQIVLEGYVEPGERRMEGPFGDHTGYYSLADLYPVFHVTCMTHRKDAIYPATIVGRPPQEDCYMAKATERLFLPLIKKTMPEVIDMNLPIEGIFHNLVFISIDKRYPGHAKKVMHAIWGLGQMMFSKIICVFDKEVDVQDVSHCLWRLGNNVDPRRDTVFVDGPVDALDHASPLPHYGSKMGIDCTKKWPEEGFMRKWPDIIEMDRDVKTRIDRLWPKLGLDRRG
ncbi:menaquinone biosynthesis decarboxylase [Dissulfurimicrobium hydrothermale]|uniref:menaquinone biosynthesis decarboxylase n=1 Tax=Dissulfurimicrobium hydrothermale TaxID=1750598 RepID=UPI001EDC2F3F|nr:menaquinone biosynthesis decarboxylase [Dissulfurimicrobium hydrothermale]UKL14306.1 menaquinone biosynthesis decarboxylase [Dissulfurimicrobium hydrothermale]